jgi:hypothetical protein
MEMQFYVFGVPKGFDLYGGRADDIAYFQSYYDGSKENSKLIFHRLIDGKVIYSYLCYNLIDCDGRSGAFLGISAIFNEIYCTDIISLYELFDEVYKTILVRGILLKAVNTQTMFGVRTLKDAESEITRITGILKRNIDSLFVDELKKIDHSFKQNINNDKVCNLNLEAGNDTILKISKNFPIISVSFEYEKSRQIEKRITLDELNDLNIVKWKVGQTIDLLEKEKQKIIKFLDDRNNSNERRQQIKLENSVVTSYNSFNVYVIEILGECNKCQKKIHKYLQIQKDHQFLLNLDDYFKNCRNVVSILQEPINVITPVIKQFGSAKLNTELEIRTKAETDKKDITEETGNAHNEKLKRIMRHHVSFSRNFTRIISLVGSVLLLVAIIVVLFKMPFYHSSSSKIDCPECAQYLDNGDNLLQNNQFSQAIAVYQKADARGVDVSTKLEEVKSKAVDFYKGQAEEEFNNSGRRKVESYNETIKQLEYVKKYDPDFDFDASKDKYKKKTVDYYLNVIDTTKNKDDLTKYAGFVLQFDPDNTDAKKVIDSLKQKAETKTTNKCIKDYAISGDKVAKDYSPEELYGELQKYPPTSYQIIIDGCKKIESSCASTKMKKNARKWREEAEKKKGEQPRPH